MLRLGSVKFCLRMAPELLAAFVAHQTAGFFTWLKSGAFFLFLLIRCSSLDLVEWFVLVLFQPFEGSLDLLVLTTSMKSLGLKSNLRPPVLVTAICALSLSKPISRSWSRSEVAMATVSSRGWGGKLSDR